MKLAVAWMRGEKSTGEVREALKVSSVSQVGYLMGIALRAAWKEGMIK